MIMSQQRNSSLEDEFFTDFASHHSGGWLILR
jgi:hypothetical protein